MQKSCEAGELDCSGPLKLVIVDQIDQSQGSFRLFDYGAASAPANEYYRYSYGFGATVPSQQIFSEKAPEPSEFKNYTMNTYQFAYSQGPIGLGFTALGTAGGVPTVVVGTFAKDAFAQLYGPLAKNQAAGMEPILTAFLEGTL